MEMRRVIAALMPMLLFPASAAAQPRFEIFGGTIELPAPVQEAPEKGEKKCEPRSPWLTPMLATHATLQIADAHSTRRAYEANEAVGGRGREANPLMRWAVTSDARAYTVKAGAVAGIWWLADKDACRNPRRVLWTLIVANAVFGLVVRHNYREGTRLLEGR